MNAPALSVDALADDLKNLLRLVDGFISPFAQYTSLPLTRTLTDSTYVIPPKILPLCEQIVRLSDAVDRVWRGLDQHGADPSGLVEAVQGVRELALRLCVAIPEVVFSPEGAALPYRGLHEGLGLHRATGYARLILECRDRNMRGEPTPSEFYQGLETGRVFVKAIYTLGTDTLLALAERRPGGRVSLEVLEFVCAVVGYHRAWCVNAEAVTQWANGRLPVVPPEVAGADLDKRQDEAFAALITCREWLARVMARPRPEPREETAEEKRAARFLHGMGLPRAAVWAGAEIYAAMVEDDRDAQRALADQIMASIDVNAPTRLMAS